MADSRTPDPQPKPPTPGQQPPPEGELDRTIAAPKGDASPPPNPDRTIAGGLDATRASGAPESPGATKPTDGDPLVGAELGGCRIESLLGRGAMGAVYKARQLRLDRTVAVKVIRPDLLTDRRALKRFEIEAKTVGRFNSQHVVMIHDVGFERGVHYLVMEYVAGKNLRDFVKELPDERLPSDKGIDFLRQACQGLKEAQRLNVLHRDIKPDNLMLDERGTLKIADFGIAKPMQEDFNMTMTAELMGTPLYMSPEQCRAVEDLDYRSDLFSLGATFFYLLTGEPPVKANSVYELIETKTKIEFLSLSKVLPEMAADHPLSRVIEKMTALERDDRYQSYDELLRDLQLVEQGQAPLAERPKPRPRGTAPVKSGGGGVKIAVGVLLLALASGGAYYLLRGEGAAPVVGNGNGKSGPSLAEIDAAIEAVRGELRQNGPSEALRQKLGAIATTDPQQQQRQQLLAEQVKRGLALRTRLATVLASKPGRPELPFVDIADYYQGLIGIGSSLDASTPDLQGWLAREVVAARAEKELQPAAMTALLSAWAKWQSDRAAAGSEAAVLQTLAPRLEAIGKAREQMIALFPDASAQLSDAVPEAQLQQALAGLDVAKPDVGPQLQAVMQAFERDGPTPALQEQLGRIRPGDAATERTRQNLLNEVGTAAEALRQLGLLRAQSYPNAVLPFQDIDDYYQSIDRLLAAARLGNDQAPVWAKAARGNARAEAELGAAGVAALQQQWQRFSQEQPAATDAAQLQQRRQRLQQLVAGRQRLLQLFPPLREAIERDVPEAQLAAADEVLAAAEGLQRLLAAIAETRAVLANVRSLQDWSAQRDRLQQAVAGHQSELQRLGSPPRAAADLAQVQQDMQHWQAAAAAMAAAGKGLASGRLSDAATAVRELARSADAPAEAAAVAAAIDTCTRAFATLEQDGQLASARSSLQAARQQLAGLGALGQAALPRLDKWLQQIAAAELLVANMVPIQGGRAKTAAGMVAVEPFFLSPTEVSQGEFAAFLDDVEAACQAAGADTWSARFTVVNARVGGVLPKAATVQQLLERRSRLAQVDLPVDNLSWYEAAAYARWRKLALPTAAEWSLAAFGPEGKYKYPWGDTWSNDAIFGRSDRVRVNDRGPSWRTGPVQIHHLAGNVAEWLDAAPQGGKGVLAGGCYKDRGSDSEAQASGRLRTAELDDVRPGQGVRTILRLRDCFGDSWPQ